MLKMDQPGGTTAPSDAVVVTTHCREQSLGAEMGVQPDGNDDGGDGANAKDTLTAANPTNELHSKSSSSNSIQNNDTQQNGYSSLSIPSAEESVEPNTTKYNNQQQHSPISISTTREALATTTRSEGVNTADSSEPEPATGGTKNSRISSGIGLNQDEQHRPEEGAATSTEEQLSPNASLRRSSRVSALNAKKKLHQTIVGGSGSKEKEQSTSSAVGLASNSQQLQQLQQEKGPTTKISTEVKSEPTTEIITTEAEVIDKQSPQMVQEKETASTMPSVSMHADEENPDTQQRVSAMKLKLKRKLDDGEELDQYDCKFGIRLDDQGDVVMMSDESEISSLNEEDVVLLKERYENVRKQDVSEEVKTQREFQIRELEATLRIEEAKLLMLKKLRQSQQQHAEKKQQQEGIRRLAPGVVQNSLGQAYKPKVAVVNQPNQAHQPQNATLGAAAKLNGTASHHSGGTSKKGASSKQTTQQQDSASVGGLQSITGAGGAAGIQLSTLPPQHLQVIQQLYERLSQNPQQMANLIKTLPPPTGQALTELLRQYAMAQATGGAAGTATQVQPTQQQSAQSTTKSTPQSTATATSALTQAQIDAANKQARELTQQNIAKHRQQLRRDLDQLITKLPVQKAPPPDLMFIPNGNQPEFLYLLGLDFAVQRVLKDKQMFRKPDFPPYQCEECETDFTPSWKAICGGENEDYHLYCERCVRQAQKRKVCHDNKTLLGRVFQQIKEREKEFERQITAGKFTIEPVYPTPPPPPPVPPPTKVLQQQNNVSASPASVALAQTASDLKNPAAAALQQLSQQQNASAAAAALNLSKSATTTPTISAPAKMKNTTPSVNQQKSSTAAPATTTTSRRVANTNLPSTTAPATSNVNSSSTAAGNPLAALFQQNPLMQQQFAAMTAISNSPILRQIGQLTSNPMMLAAMTQNPMLIQQLFQAAITQQQQQQHQQQQQRSQQSTASNATSNASTTNFPAGAAAALAQLAQKSTQMQHQQQQAQQQHHHHRSSTSSHSHHQSLPASSTNTSTAAVSSTATSSSNSNATQQQQALAAMAAMMNSAAAANPLLQLTQLGAQNPQMFRQLSSHPQFQQMMQMYMQQMKAAGGKK